MVGAHPTWRSQCGPPESLRSHVFLFSVKSSTTCLVPRSWPNYRWELAQVNFREYLEPPLDNSARFLGDLLSRILYDSRGCVCVLMKALVLLLLEEGANACVSLSPYIIVFRWFAPGIFIHCCEHYPEMPTTPGGTFWMCLFSFIVFSSNFFTVV